VLSWLFVGLLVIIWLFFLLPTRGRSPAASVEEFELKMSLLAETNRDSPGRWVLMPRRRFLDPKDRARARVVRRRRTIFTALLEATGLLLLMGLVPPLRLMLFGAGGLVFLLLVYSAILVQIKSSEVERARRDMRRLADRRASAPRRPASRVTYPDGYAPGTVHVGVGRRSSSSTNGNGSSSRGRKPNDLHTMSNGHSTSNGIGHRTTPRSPFDDGTLELLDDDVHVVIRRAHEVAAEAELAAPSRIASGG
jgi:hypothetical protein